MRVAGSQTPRVAVHPDFKILPGSGDEIADFVASYDLDLDPWQRYVLKATHCENAKGGWITPRAGLVVPRQQGKTQCIVARELAGLVLLDEQVILHTSIELKASLDVQRKLRSFFDNYDDLRKMVKSITTANGAEAITLKNGSMIRFLARSRTSARGMSANLIVIDEAQDLTYDEWSAILPTTLAVPNSMTFLAGTPPTNARGEVFTSLRNEALEGKNEHLAWLEWSAEPDCDPDDREQWAKALPALNLRVPEEAVADARSTMSTDSFCQELLGMFNISKTVTSVIDSDSWNLCSDENSKATSGLTLAIDIAPNRSVASVALAGARDDGLPHVELVENRSGVDWIVPWVAEKVKNNDIRAVVADAKSPTGLMKDKFKQAGVNLTLTNYEQYQTACADFYDSVMGSHLRHIDQPQLNYALSMARKRATPDGRWLWARKDDTDISSVVAITLALWGFSNSKVKAPEAGQRRRKITVLGSY